MSADDELNNEIRRRQMLSLPGRCDGHPVGSVGACQSANLGQLRLQHREAEAPNAIMGWTVFNPGENSGPGSDIRWRPRSACAAARNFKVEASAYFEHYTYQTKRWSDVTNLHAIDLINEVKVALAESATKPRPPIPRVALGVTGNNVARKSELPQVDLHGLSAAEPVALAPFARQPAPGLTLTAVHNYVEAMRPTWTASEAEERTKGFRRTLRTWSNFFRSGERQILLSRQTMSAGRGAAD